MNKEAQSPLVLDHASVLDVIKGALIPDQRVTIAHGRIVRIESAHTRLTDTETRHVINLEGKTLMPGLCDADVHVTAWTANLAEVGRSSPNYTAIRAAGLMEAMLKQDPPKDPQDILKTTKHKAMIQMLAEEIVLNEIVYQMR